MTTLQTNIQVLVDSFVSQVTELARRAAIATLESALGAAPRGGKAKGGSVGSLGRIGAGRGRGGKRTAGQLGQLQDELLVFVRANPGLRIEQINKQLGTTTRDLALPIRKLVADGALKTKGRRRSTAYFAGEGGRRSKAKN